MTKTKSFNKNTKHKALYHDLMESILECEDAMDKGVANKSKKRKPDDANRDEGPPAGSNQGLKRKKIVKDVEPSKKAKSTKPPKSPPILSQNLLASMHKQMRQCLSLEILKCHIIKEITWVTLMNHPLLMLNKRTGSRNQKGLILKSLISRKKFDEELGKVRWWKGIRGRPLVTDINKGTKSGPLSRPVSTRLQLQEQALFCYYDAFLSSVEHKTYKEALTQACWIEAMREKIHEFERLE
nr:integrase, catalytic region, zinc finger, CCHC-type, peptidase aspartic, catalytic [Tanacetum cinerariifolium]